LTEIRSAAGISKAEEQERQGAEQVVTAACCTANSCKEVSSTQSMQPKLPLRGAPDQRLGATQGIQSGQEVPALGTNHVLGLFKESKQLEHALAIPLAEYSVQEKLGSASRFSRVDAANARACWIGFVVCLQQRSNSADSKNCLTCTFSNSDLPHSCAVMFKLVLMAQGSMLTLTAYHL